MSKHKKSRIRNESPFEFPTKMQLLEALFFGALSLNNPDAPKSKLKPLHVEANTAYRADGTLVVHWKHITPMGKKHISVRDDYTLETFWAEVEEVRSNKDRDNTVTVRGVLAQP